MINSILVISDCAPGDVTSLEKARQLASPFDAKLEVIRFVKGRVVDDLGGQVEAARQDLSDDLHQVFGAQPPASQVVITEDIAGWIAENNQQNHVDLVIKTGHRSERSFYTPTDWHLIRNLSCHILIASDTKWRAKPVLMATIDVNEDSRAQQALNSKVLATAPYFAHAAGSEIAVAYSLPIPQALLELDIIEQDSYAKKHQSQVEQLMQNALAEAGLGNASIHIKAGPPEKSLPSLANSIKADLVVVGSVGRKGLSGAVLGNTAEKMLSKLRTDVLIVKP